MFILDSLLISGLRWTLETIRTAADAELNDDTALRERLLDAEMRRELGELSDEEFRRVEADLLARIRDIRERRDGGPGAFAFGERDIGGAGGGLTVEATVAGDFHEHEPAPAAPAETRSPRSARRPSPAARVRGPHASTPVSRRGRVRAGRRRR